MTQYSELLQDPTMPLTVDIEETESLLSGPSELSQEFARGVMALIENSEPLANASTVTGLVEALSSEAVDPYRAVTMLASSSAEMAALFSGSVGVREGYRLHEHTQAVLSRFEPSATQYNPEERRLLRTALLLQDAGKPLAVARHGDREQQSFYNEKVAANVLEAVDPSVLGDDEKQLIILLIGHNVIGSAVQGEISIGDAKKQLDVLKAKCPEKYQKDFLRFAQPMYLSDVTAYTSYARYRSGEKMRRAKPSLNVAFRRDRSGDVTFRFATHRRIFEALTGERVSTSGLDTRLGATAMHEAGVELSKVVEVLDGVELDPSFDAKKLRYDPRFGGLTLPEADGTSRIVMFRGHERRQEAAKSVFGVGELANRSLEEKRIDNSMYGTGLYAGNSAQAVAAFGWKDGRAVSVYLSPPIFEEEILDLRGRSDEREVDPARIKRHVGAVVSKMIAMRTLGKGTALNGIDASYGDSKAVLFDMGSDTYILQRALAQTHGHAIKPAWYVWRGREGDFQKIGEVNGAIAMRPTAQRAISARNSIRQKRAAKRGART